MQNEQFKPKNLEVVYTNTFRGFKKNGEKKVMCDNKSPKQQVFFFFIEISPQKKWTSLLF